jgi:legumain
MFKSIPLCLVLFGHAVGQSPATPMLGAEHHWAVIMAGSNTYGNYRHQADACHAYQIAKKNGIPESNIILLAYDDIANNRENPFPGKMYNKPDGPDVYAGCKISYKGKDVTKANFIKVLTGDASASGPTLKSTANDKVFVYFADHGGVGILGVPDGAAGGYIHANDVNSALETMHSKGMYKELLFYVEACESGSIFKGLLKAPNVVAVTAANAKESSWGWYCPPQDKVNGKRIGSCLGDEFSIKWMEDSDVADFKSETVGQQITKVTGLVTKSHVQQFGDNSTIGKEVIGAFEGAQASSAGLSMPLNTSWAQSIYDSSFAVNSRDIEVHLAYYKLRDSETLEQRRDAEKQLSALLGTRSALDDTFMRIAMLAMNGDKAKAEAMINGDLEELGNLECHVKALEALVDNCGPFNDYTMRYSRLFANLCNTVASPFVTVDRAIKDVCKKSDIVV